MAGKTGIIVQARMGSTRLPGKVMMDIAGKPMLQGLIERLRKSRLADELIIATTRRQRDEAIVSCAEGALARVFRGDEDDVLGRYYYAAKEAGLETVVRVTSDCPLADPFLIDDMVRHFLRTPSIAYMSNTVTRTYPRGFDAEVFSFGALEKAFLEAKAGYEREHVTPYIYERMPASAYLSDGDSSSYRVTVDTAEDLRLVREIFKELSGLEFIMWHDVVALLKRRPDLASINSGVKQKAVRTI